MSNSQHSDSALQNVFGSHVSLAELNGDVNSRANSRVPSRVPSPRPQSSQNTKRARSRTITQKPRRRYEKMSKPQLTLRALILFLTGALTVFSATHFIAVGRLGPELAAKVPDFIVSATMIGGLLALAMGLLFGIVLPNSGTPQNGVLHTHYDWPSFVRGTGAILGLSYATTKIQSAWMFWGLANPVLWYVIDSSLPGFMISAAFSVLGGGSAVRLLGCGNHDALIVLSCFFSAAIMWGGLGRRLL